VIGVINDYLYVWAVGIPAHVMAWHQLRKFPRV
jgi:hypothetical protein